MRCAVLCSLSHSQNLSTVNRCIKINKLSVSYYSWMKIYQKILVSDLLVWQRQFLHVVRTLKNLVVFYPYTKQLLDEVEHDIMNYQPWGLNYQITPTQGLIILAIMRKLNSIIALSYNLHKMILRIFRTLHGQGNLRLQSLISHDNPISASEIGL